jgi:DNA-directed RNA polymerase sigma subunit (sigma70/sigma32)
LEELKTSLQSQFGREPTLAEWAEGAGLNCCRKLKAQLRRGSKSREKLIQANSRMVHYVAKSYQGRGLSLEDLLQVDLDIPSPHYTKGYSHFYFRISSVLHRFST